MARLRRLPWRALAGVALAAAGLTLGWLWFRDSSLARVRTVTVLGATSTEEDRVRAAIEEAARGMSTLHVRRDELEAAVEHFPSVAGLSIEPDFPHDLTVEVLEHRPVAALRSGGRTVPATGGGRLLEGLEAKHLPILNAKRPAVGGKVTDRRTLGALRVAAAAPEPLRRRSERLWFGPRGMTLDLRDGPVLIFGSGRDARAKWSAAARVLAEPSAAGAVYLDLRIPGRVAAGGVGPITPEETPQPPNPQP